MGAFVRALKGKSGAVKTFHLARGGQVRRVPVKIVKLI